MSEIITTTIKSLSHDGRGIATINNKTTFIPGALPGEEITCKITKKHSRYLEASIIDILTAAPERTTPGCKHFNICGGCSMQHIHIDHQIQWKQTALLEQLKHFGKVIPEKTLAPITGNPWGYRRKARLGVRYVFKKEKLLVGFREKFSNYLADITECPVLHPSIGTHLTELAEVVRSLSQYEHIPQVEVAIGDEITALVVRHMTQLSEQDLQLLCNFAEKFNFHLYLQPNSPQTIQKLWPKNSSDLLSYRLSEYQLELQFHPLDFTQVNGEINPLMIKQALELLDLKPHETVLDLFCGLGNFTLPMARSAQFVTGVEGSQEMVKRALENAKHNQIENTEFFAANLMDTELKASWLEKQYDKILLDPPRLGAKEIIPLLSNCNAKKIVYVSCNPATLARDAGELVYNHGYTLKQAGVINMFPHTSHIEAIALFEK